ncbi:uncharacterized protein LOC110861980 [Folsomia candida]|uniref:uncharacterized protein LOC110861980 n=1 Tax=Folsomia candida TaxID=158441 RepID=UPI000B8F3D9C|nr:uncharacterized protein LOC110861980 [Folsomia candida]
MPICILTCEARSGYPNSWHISILGLDVELASEMRSRHTELNPGSGSAVDTCIVHYKRDLPTSPELVVHNGVRDTFRAMSNRPEAILKLAAKYINSLESLHYKLKSTTADVSEGKSKWTFTLRSPPSKSPSSKWKQCIK